MSGIPEWATERLLNASSETVWKAWTDPTLFSRWYGPGVETIVHEMDVRAGGQCRIELKSPNGSINQRFEYLSVEQPEKLSWAFATADENWELTRSPLIEHWPGVLISTMSIELLSGKPMMRFTWSPYRASDEEIVCFKAHRVDIDAAWNAAFSALEATLAETESLSE